MERTTVDIPSPYLAFAVFCERALVETDSTLSLVRIVERATKHPGHDPERRRPMMRISLAVGLRSGDYKGKGKLRVEGSTPSNKKLKPAVEMEIELAGGDTGANVIIEMNVPAEENGTYWFDLFFEDRMLTRTPLTFLESATTTPTSPHPPDDRQSSGSAH